MSENDAKVGDKAGDLAKSIWLAGLGAYGKAFDEAQGRYEKVSKETSRMFDELVVKGKKLEDDTSGKLHDAKEKSTSTLDERITKVRQSLGFGEFSKDAKIDDLSAKVEELSHKLDQVLKAVGETEQKPKAARSRSASKSSEA
jgi:predicted  nucleic acid-binding Zn-ribbon protein